jgi:DNA-binding GntR family transcriptional regulator
MQLIRSISGALAFASATGWNGSNRQVGQKPTMARTDERFRAAFNRLLDICEAMTSEDQFPSEIALSTQLEVSRTVIRNGLERLKVEGIISWAGREKAILRRPTQEDRLMVQSEQLTAPELERQFLDWILRFDVAPGTALNVSELARRFQVTPYLLQEFLASLSRFGLVRKRSRGGWDLLGFTREFAVELSEFRLMLELNAVSHLVMLPDDHPVWPQLDALEASHLQLAHEIDRRFHDFSLLDEAFHATIGSVVKNRFTSEFQKLIALIFHYHYQWDKTNERLRNQAAIGEHLRIIAALRGRSKAEAMAATESHLKTSKLTLLESLRDHAIP